METQTNLKEKEVIITEIIEFFNWSKVALVMEVLDYKWDFSDFKNRRPTIAEMKEVARDILEKVYEGESNLMARGGFVASIHSGILELQFTISSKYAHLEYSDEEMNLFQ